MVSITWDRDAAAHLLRRAGLPGPPEEVDALHALGPEQAVASLLEFEAVDDSALEARLAGLELDLTRRVDIEREWLVRLVHTRRPFRERMALFWHSHFATAITKVKGPTLMHQQIETFRTTGRSRFEELLLAVARDPAMLIWLDNIDNHRSAPNENWARELLELYSMGIGSYTQADVLAAARAFTGWTLRRQVGGVVFAFNPSDHDFGTKTFLGETGAFDGGDIIAIICRQPVTARFLATSMWRHFAAMDPPEAVLDRLVDAYFGTDQSLLEVFRALFTSPELYAPEQRRARLKGPVEFTCGLLRQLRADIDGRQLGAVLTGQGQTLYDPPDPSGWPEGEAWMTTASLLLRSQLASVIGLAGSSSVTVDLPALLATAGVATPEGAVDHLAGRLDLPLPSFDRRTQLVAYLTTNAATGRQVPFDLRSGTTRFKLAGLVHLLASEPAAQTS